MIEIGKFSQAIAVNDENNLILVITQNHTLMEFQRKGYTWEKVKLQKIHLNINQKVQDVLINITGNKFTLLTNQYFQIWIKEKENFSWSWSKTIKFNVLQVNRIKFEAGFGKQQIVDHTIINILQQSQKIKNICFSCLNNRQKLIFIKQDEAFQFSVSNSLNLIAKQQTQHNNLIRFLDFRNPFKIITPLEINTIIVNSISFSENNQLVIILSEQIQTLQLVKNHFQCIVSVNVKGFLNSVFTNGTKFLQFVFGNYFILQSDSDQITIVDQNQRCFESKKELIKLVLAQNKMIAIIEQSIYKGKGKKKKHKFELRDLDELIINLKLIENPELDF